MNKFCRIVCYCAFCFFSSNGFGDEGRGVVASDGSAVADGKEKVMMSVEKLRGKTLKFDYSKAVYSSDYLYWRERESYRKEGIKMVKVDEDGSFVVPDWRDESKERKLVYKQMAPNIVVFDRDSSSDIKGEDSYQMMFLTPTSAIAWRLTGTDEYRRLLLVANIKVSVTDGAEGDGVGEKKGGERGVREEFVPERLDGKKIVFYPEGEIHWNPSSLTKRWTRVEDAADKSWELIFEGKESKKGAGAIREDWSFHYYKTSDETAFISTFSYDFMVYMMYHKDVEMEGEGTGNLEYQLMFTAPNEGYVLGIYSAENPVSFSMFTRFRIVDADDASLGVKGGEELRGKSLELDYSEAVFWANPSHWLSKEKTSLKLVKDVRFDEGGGFSASAWYDSSKMLRFDCKQMSPNIFVFEGKGEGELSRDDSYQVLLLTPDSGVAMRMMKDDASKENDLRVLNIKVKVVDSSLKSGEVVTVEGKEIVKEEKEEKEGYAPDSLDGKTVYFDFKDSLFWDAKSTNGRWWYHYTTLDSKSFVFKGNRSGVSWVEGGWAVYYHKTGANTGEISTSRSLVSPGDKGWGEGSIERLIFTSPTEGHAVFSERAVRRDYLTMFVKFRVVDSKEVNSEVKE